MRSDFAEHESSESINAETFSLQKYQNRGTRPLLLSLNILRIEAYGLMKSHSDFYFMRAGVRLLCSYKDTKAALLPECRNSVLNFYAFLMNTSRRSRPLSISVSEVA